MSKHITSVISSLFGKFASYKFPKSIQNLINNSYVRLMGLDMSEFDSPQSYPTLNALFTRALVTPRGFADDNKEFLSPCDALITDIGTITDNKAYQIKGMSYNIKPLLGSFKDDAKILNGGKYANFYLSPKDYHRYHSPTNLQIEAIEHIPGKLYPVNMPLLKRRVNLFIENERVVLKCKDEFDKLHYLILVGALNVGKMVVTIEPRISTNSSITKPVLYSYNKPKILKKAELLGWFEMGSTILILSEPNSIEYSIKVGEKVKFAQPIATIGGNI